MLIAVHPDSKELHSQEYPQCFSQGQLLYALEKEPCQEILLDGALPGHLKLEDLLNYIHVHYPDAQVSVIEPPGLPIPQNLTHHKVFPLALPALTGGVSILAYLLLTVGGEQQFMPICISLGTGIIVTTLFGYLRGGGYE